MTHPVLELFFHGVWGMHKILALGVLQMSSVDFCAAGEPGKLPLGSFS